MTTSIYSTLGVGRVCVAIAATLLCLLTGSVVSAQIEDYRPVTDEMLQNPEPADWLSWRRTLDGQAHLSLIHI